MTKKAKTTHNIHEFLEERWSPRAFRDEKIDLEKLAGLFEAARWSPSASNLQPWYYIVGMKGDETYSRIMECLVEFNQMWAGSAPVLCLTIGDSKNPKGEDYSNFQYDIGQSIAHLTFQAHSEGLFIHQMSGIYPEKAKKLFDIPEQYEVLTAFVIGYLGDPEILHPRMQKSEIAERERKDLDTFVFQNKFGEKASFI